MHSGPLAAAPETLGQGPVPVTGPGEQLLSRGSRSLQGQLRPGSSIDLPGARKAPSSRWVTTCPKHLSSPERAPLGWVRPPVRRVSQVASHGPAQPSGRLPTAFWKGHCHCEHLLDTGSPSQPSRHGRRRRGPAQGSAPWASTHPQPKPGVGPSPAPSAHHSSGHRGSGWGWAAEARSPRPVPPPPCRLPSALCAAYQVTGAGSCVHA